jgi:hypothetical protein
MQTGLEALVWSRLRVLSDFRFPVETADYFFGMFFQWGESDYGWRARIGHISSHIVDGTDTGIVGGSSSKYSREFVEIMRQNPWGDHYNILWNIGLRFYFHQVTKSEPLVAVPASITWRFAGDLPLRRQEILVDGSLPQMGEPQYAFYLFASSGSGPIWPNAAGGIRAERTARDLGTLDFELSYQYGASWAGTDARIKRSTINLQMDVRGF